MAELEVIKHSKKVYKIWNNRSGAFWHKLQEFGIEVVIIVFAVSLTIWFHELAAHRHEATIEKKFLWGIRTDLVKDLQEMTEDSLLVSEQYQLLQTCKNLAHDPTVSTDSIVRFMNTRSSLLYRMILFRPNAGRYEGFKSAGQLRLIENDLLAESIVDLYEESIPVLLYLEHMYIDFKMANFDAYNLGKENLAAERTYLKNYFSYTAESLSNIRQEYHEVMKQTRQVLKIIEK